MDGSGSGFLKSVSGSADKPGSIRIRNTALNKQKTKSLIQFQCFLIFIVFPSFVGTLNLGERCGSSPICQLTKMAESVLSGSGSVSRIASFRLHFGS